MVAHKKFAILISTSPINWSIISKYFCELQMKIKYLSYQFIMHVLSVCRKDLLIFQFFFLHFSPKIFLHQRLFHQFQLFKALLYDLLLLVYTLHKGGKLVLEINRRQNN